MSSKCSSSVEPILPVESRGDCFKLSLLCCCVSLMAAGPGSHAVADVQLNAAFHASSPAGQGGLDEPDLTGNAMTLLVTSILDSGDDQTIGESLAADEADGNGLSIREALFWVEEGESVTFDLNGSVPGNQGGTITLNGSPLSVAKNDISIDGDLDGDGFPDVTISGNNASRVMAVNSGLSGIELNGLILSQGNGVAGGGLSLGTTVEIVVRDSRIVDNTESGLGGGGIFGSSVTLTLINSTVSGNSSDLFGGGIRIVGGGTLNVISSTIRSNTTTGTGAHGGGIQYAGPALTIINSTISGNAAVGANSDGGGLRISTGTSYIHNSTIAGNAASNNGGGVSANGISDNFANVVVAGNTAGAGAAPGIDGSPLASGGSDNDVSGTIEVATNSYFGTNTVITEDNDCLNNQGTGNLLLSDLDFYHGSPIQTHFAQPGSALLEAGSNVALPPDSFDLDHDGDFAEALPVDANGNPRVVGIVDIGAVELMEWIFSDRFEP